MADNNNSNKKRDGFNALDRFTNSVGALARSAIVALPIGLATRDLMQKIRSGQVVLSVPSPQSTSSKTLLEGLVGQIRNINTANNNPMFPIKQLDTLLDMADTGHLGSKMALREGWETTKLTKNAISSAWQRAARNSGLPQTMIDLLATKIQQAQTGGDALKDISLIARNNQSVYMKRAVSLFLSDTQFLEQRAGLGLASETTKLVSGLPPYTKTMFSMNRLPGRMQNELREMAGILGVTPKLEMISRHDKGPGKMLNVSFSGGKLGQKTLSVNVPMTIEGTNTFAHGVSLQSKYIAGRYGIVEGGKLQDVMSHEEFALHRIKSDLIPEILNDKRITQSKIRQMTTALEMTLLSPPEWIESLPAGVHRGLDEYVKHKQQILRLYAPGGGRYDPIKGVFDVPTIDETEYYKILGQGQLEGPSGKFPVFAPSSPTQVAQNVVMTSDPRRLHPVLGELFPVVRRPMQFLRKSYAPTADALQAMQTPLQKEFAWAKMAAGIETPVVPTMYISERHAKALSAAGIGTQGTIAIASELEAQRRFDQLATYNVATEEVGTDLAKLLTDKQTHWDLYKQMPEGMFLGRDPTGVPVTLPSKSELLTARVIEDRNRSRFLQITATTAQENLDWTKVFLGGKGMAGQVSGQHIANVSSKILGRKVQYGEAMAIVAGGELKKNRQLHYHQLFTSLWQHSKVNMQSGKSLNQLAVNFVKDPLAIIADMKKKAERSGKYSHEIFLAESMQVARGAGLNPRQISEVYGMVPDVFGFRTESPHALMSDWSASLMKATGTDVARAMSLGQQEAKEILRGGALGFSQFFPEGIEGPGSGGRGTIEPRLLDTLDSPWWGETGQLVKADIVKRMAAQHSTKLVEQSILGGSLASMLSLQKITGSIAPSAVTEELMQKGFSLQLTGLGDILVPGAERLSQLAQYTTTSGLPVTPELSTQYKHFLEMARSYEKGNITKDVMRGELDTLIGQTTKSWVGTVSGKGGLFRGELPGSTFLTSVTSLQRGHQGLDPGAHGITSSAAERMFSDLEMFIKPEDMKVMREQFYGGKPLAGFMFRHPGISPYSNQPALFQFVPGEGNVLVTPEVETRGVLMKGQLAEAELQSLQSLSGPALKGNISAKNILERAGGQFIETLRLGQAPGLGADYDADIPVASFVGPDLQPALQKKFSEMGNDYFDYSLRMQLLKGKARKGEEITLAAAIADDAIKLGATKRGKLGQVSNALSLAKAAVFSQSKNMSKEAMNNSLFLLEWLEQTPISAKHIAPGHAEELVDALSSVTESVRNKDSGKLIRTVEQIMSSEVSKARGSLLTEGATLAFERPGGKIETRFLPSIDLHKTAETITSSISNLENMQIDGVKGSRIHQLLLGKGRPASPDEASALMSRGIKMFSMGEALEEIPVAKGIGKKLSEHYMSFTNQLAAAGKGLLPHAKPLALGFGAAIALSSILSSPPLTVDPASKIAPRADMRSGTGGINQEMHPPDYIPGSPRVPPSIPPGRAFVTNNPGGNIMIRGRSQGNQDYSGLSNSIGQTIPGSSVRSRVNDERRSLTPWHVSHMLKGG